jgi:hypothetical protein
MGGIGGLIGISGGSHSSQATTTETVTNSGNTTKTASDNTDNSVNLETGSSNINAGGNLSISSIDPGAIALADNASKRASDAAKDALAAAAQFGNNAFMAQTRTGDTLAAALTASQLPSQGANVKLYVGVVVAALLAVVYLARKGKS